ncbi:hypothetical protein [Paracoccus sulfuroxidans]|uniref:Uncharacterized protein n=1 Tax=Paracoccus sulfuroxidans TaxID=384678 RepID=A0A562NLA2_9RHOB|nr:hypothetical protein [Paracoccus sulfuroxidans]TWI32771.1 hypothetical protein IQ24_02646 [Paracoccus sulfuroxidans]
MSTTTMIFKSLALPSMALAAAMLWSAPAQANLNCPAGSEEYNGQCWSPNPSQPPSNVTATGGNSSSTATIGDVGGGTATTGPINVSTGPSTSNSGVTGSGNSDVRNNVTNRNDIANTNQQGQQQGQYQQASANNSIRIDNRTRQSAAQAAPVILGGYGQQNCFGDTNSSGQFGASMQVFGWGVSANSSKASNVCAAYAIGGPAMAVGYLQRMDPNMPRRVTVEQPTGRLTCPASHPVYVPEKGCRK